MASSTGVQVIDNLILSFNRISNEKKETFLKLLVLSICAILCKPCNVEHVHYLCSSCCSFLHTTVRRPKIRECNS